MEVIHVPSIHWSYLPPQKLVVLLIA